MNWLKKIFGDARESAKPTPATSDTFPDGMIGCASMVIINYEGQDVDRVLEQNVVKRFLPLAASGCGFKTWCNATVPSLKQDEPSCGMIQIDGGQLKAGVSLDSYSAYLASKDKIPPEHASEFGIDKIGYWIGTENGKRVHAIVLLGDKKNVSQIEQGRNEDTCRRCASGLWSGRHYLVQARDGSNLSTRMAFKCQRCGKVFCSDCANLEVTGGTSISLDLRCECGANQFAPMMHE